MFVKGLQCSLVYTYSDPFPLFRHFIGSTWVELPIKWQNGGEGFGHENIAAVCAHQFTYMQYVYISLLHQ